MEQKNIGRRDFRVYVSRTLRGVDWQLLTFRYNFSGLILKDHFWVAWRLNMGRTVRPET
jgi:hypothetical protein